LIQTLRLKLSERERKSFSDEMELGRSFFLLLIGSSISALLLEIGGSNPLLLSLRVRGFHYLFIGVRF